jgi:hypothetical protein
MWLLLPPPSLWIHVLQRLALPIGAEMAQLSNLSTFLYLAFLFVASNQSSLEATNWNASEDFELIAAHHKPCFQIWFPQT